MLVVQTRDWLRSHNSFKASSQDIEVIVHYIASALLGLLIWWVVNDFPYPADVMAKKFNRLAVGGLSGIENIDLSQHTP